MTYSERRCDLATIHLIMPVPMVTQWSYDIIYAGPVQAEMLKIVYQFYQPGSSKHAGLIQNYLPKYNCGHKSINPLHIFSICPSRQDFLLNI